MKPQKNILILYGKGELEISNRQSALGSYMLCLCNLLEKKDYNVLFNTISIKEANQKTNTYHTINPVKKTNLFTKNIPPVIKNLIKDIQKFNFLKSIREKVELLNTNPDIVIEFYNYGSNLGAYFSTKFNCPLIIIYDAPVIEEYEFFNGKKIFFRRKIEQKEKTSLKRANSILVYSEPVKRYLQEKYSNLSNTNFFIHQNVDYTRFEFLLPKPISNEPVIGFIGSFLKWHRADLLLQAFYELKQEGLTAKLILAGNGQELEIIKNKALELGLKKHVTFTGFIDGEDLFRNKSLINIGIMPGSNWYGAPNKIFEYGAAGMAVVAPDTPTIRYLFSDEKEVLFFRMDDVKDLKEKIKRILTDKKLYTNLCNGLQKKIKNMYSPEITIDFYNKMIEQTLYEFKKK